MVASVEVFVYAARPSTNAALKTPEKACKEN